MRIVRVLFQRDAEGPFAHVRLVRLQRRAPPWLGYRTRVIGRLGVNQAALGLAGHLELFERAAGMAVRQFEVGLKLLTRYVQFPGFARLVRVR